MIQQHYSRRRSLRQEGQRRWFRLILQDKEIYVLDDYEINSLVDQKILS